MRGVYAITNMMNGRVYYGQSKNIENRWKHHIRSLKGNYHKNSNLQRSWNKYGANVFSFSPIELIEDISVSLTPVEKKYFDSTSNKFNEADPEDPTACSLETRQKISTSKILNGVVPPSQKGRIRSEESRRKMSLAKQKFHGRRGKHNSEEHKRKQSISSKLYWSNKKEIL